MPQSPILIVMDISFARTDFLSDHTPKPYSQNDCTAGTGALVSEGLEGLGVGFRVEGFKFRV